MSNWADATAAKDHGMSTGTGTLTDPIVAMSADLEQIRRDVRASLAHFGRTDDPYWLEKESTPAQFSNGLWHLGHNRYWEARMDPTNPGSADPTLGKVVALYWSEVTVPVPPMVVPPVVPVDEVPPTTATDVRLYTLLTLLTSAVNELVDQHARLDVLNGRLATVQSQLTQLMTRPMPPYKGSLFGVPITLSPVVPK
jgi:hypothetical protein